MKIILFIILLILTISGFSQENANDLKRFIFGVNAGAKFANKDYARRYTGRDQNQLENFFSNADPNNYQRIRELLGNKDFLFDSYSTLYRWQPAISYGVNFGFQASPNLSFEVDLNFANIRMFGGYTLNVINPDNFTTQANFVNGNISGNEARFNGKLNMNYLTDGDNVKGVFGISGLVNSWRMEENFVELAGSNIFNLFNAQNPANGFTTRVRGTGLGYGVNIGIQLPFKKGIVMQIVYQPYATRMDYDNTLLVIDALGPDYIKPPVKIEHDIMARFIWR